MKQQSQSVDKLQYIMQEVEQRNLNIQQRIDNTKMNSPMQQQKQLSRFRDQKQSPSAAMSSQQSPFLQTMRSNSGFLSSQSHSKFKNFIEKSSKKNTNLNFITNDNLTKFGMKKNYLPKNQTQSILHKFGMPVQVEKSNLACYIQQEQIESSNRQNPPIQKHVQSKIEKNKDLFKQIKSISTHNQQQQYMVAMPKPQKTAQQLVQQEVQRNKSNEFSKYNIVNTSEISVSQFKLIQQHYEDLGVNYRNLLNKYQKKKEVIQMQENELKIKDQTIANISLLLKQNQGDLVMQLQKQLKGDILSKTTTSSFKESYFTSSVNKQQNKDLEKSLNKVKSDNTNLIMQQKEKDKQIEEINYQLAKLQQEIEVKSNSNKILTNQLNIANIDLEKLQLNLNDTQKQFQDTNIQTQKITQENEFHLQKIAKLKMKKMTFLQQIQQQQQIISQYQTKKESNKDEEKDLQLQQYQNIITQYEENLNSLCQEKRELNNRIQLLDQNYNDLQRIANNTQSQDQSMLQTNYYEEEKVDIKEYENRIQDYTVEVGTLNSKVQYISTENQQLTRQLENLKTTHQSFGQQYEEEIKEYQNKIQQYQTDFNIIQKKYNLLQQEKLDDQKSYQETEQIKYKENYLKLDIEHVNTLNNYKILENNYKQQEIQLQNSLNIYKDSQNQLDKLIKQNQLFKENVYQKYQLQDIVDEKEVLTLIENTIQEGKNNSVKIFELSQKLNKERESKKLKNNEILEMNSQLLEEKGELNNINVNLKQQINSLNEKIINIKNENQNKEFQEKNIQKNELGKQINQKNEEIQEKKNIINDLKQKIDQKNEEINNKQSSVIDMKQQLNQKNEEIQHEKNKVQKINEENQKIYENIQELQVKHQNIQSDHQQNTEELNKSFNLKIKQYQNEIEFLNQNNQKFEESNLQFKDNITQLKIQNNNLQNEILEKEDEIIDFQNQIKQNDLLKQQINALQKQLKQDDNTIQQLQEEKQLKTKQNKLNQQNLQNQTQQSQELEQEINELKIQLKNEEIIIQNVKEENLQLKNNIQQLQDEQIRLKKKFDKYETEQKVEMNELVQNNNDMVQEMIKENTLLKQRIENQQQEEDQLKIQIQNQQDFENQLQQTIDKLKEQKLQLKQQIQQQNNDTTSEKNSQKLLQQIETQENKIEELNCNIISLNQQIQELMNDNSEFFSQLQQFEKQPGPMPFQDDPKFKLFVKQQQEQYEVEIEELEQQLKTANEEIENLKLYIEENYSYEDNSQEEKKENLSENEVVQPKPDVSDKIEDIQFQLQQKTMKQEFMSKQLEELEKEKKELYQANIQLNEKLIHIQMEIRDDIDRQALITDIQDIIQTVSPSQYNIISQIQKLQRISYILEENINEKFAQFFKENKYFQETDPLLLEFNKWKSDAQLDRQVQQIFDIFFDIFTSLVNQNKFKEESLEKNNYQVQCIIQKLKMDRGNTSNNEISQILDEQLIKILNQSEEFNYNQIILQNEQQCSKFDVQDIQQSSQKSSNMMQSQKIINEQILKKNISQDIPQKSQDIPQKEIIQQEYKMLSSQIINLKEQLAEAEDNEEKLLNQIMKLKEQNIQARADVLVPIDVQTCFKKFIEYNFIRKTNATENLMQFCQQIKFSEKQVKNIIEFYTHFWIVSKKSEQSLNI